MEITDSSRYELHQRLEEVLGAEEAAILMAHLPPVGWADVATARDLDALEERMNLRFGHVDLRFDNLELRLVARMDALGERLDGRIDALGERLDGRIDALGERLGGRIDTLDQRIDTLDRELGGRIDALGERLDGRIDTLATRIEHEMATKADVAAMGARMERELRLVAGASVGLLATLVGLIEVVA